MTKIIDLKAQGFRFTFRAGSGWNWRHPAELQPTDIDATDMKDEELVPLAKNLEAFTAAPVEFRNYPLRDLPEMPKGFEDASWHNDACPSIESRALGLRVWIDFPNPDDRELAGMGRFTVQKIDADGESVDSPDLLNTDDWSAVLAQIIATAFAGVLKRWLSPEAWAEMREANVGADPMTCASHDYCDANVAMLEAFRAVMGRDHVLDDADPRNDGDCDLWNIAWDIAKRLYLTASEGAQ